MSGHGYETGRLNLPFVGLCTFGKYPYQPDWSNIDADFAVLGGGLFAFITSFDEVVAVLFLASPEQRTIPRQMWSGIREQISPTILAVATLLVILSVILLTVIELLRRRSDRLRGVTTS